MKIPYNNIDVDDLNGNYNFVKSSKLCKILHKKCKKKIKFVLICLYFVFV